MLCELCKKLYATTTRSVDRGYGDERLAVCNDCAKRIDNNEQRNDFICDFWGTNKKLTKCGVCGTSLDTIVNTGYVGCASCYKMFSSDIAELIASVQGKYSHVGKVPLSIINKSDEQADPSRVMDNALNFGDLTLAEIARNHFPGRRRG